MQVCVSINGRIVAPGVATISVLDRGFVFADRLVERMRTYEGSLIAVEGHLGRLQRAARSVGIAVPVPLGQLRAELLALCAAAVFPETELRILLTRGVGLPSIEELSTRGPQRVILASPLDADAVAAPETLVASTVDHSIALRVAEPGAAAESYAYRLAHQKAALVPLLVHGSQVRAGEGAALIARIGHEIAVSRDPTVFEPTVAAQCAVRAASAMGSSVRSSPLRTDDLWSADELLWVDDVRGIVPIVRVDEHEVGDGAPPAGLTALRRAYLAELRSS